MMFSRFCWRPAMAVALLLPLCFAAPATAQGWLNWFGSSAEPGTPEWWDANEKKAEIVPGKGYRVPGVEGFFDSEGRPINAPVDEVSARFLAEKEESVGILPDIAAPSAVSRARERFGMGPDQQDANDALAEGERLFTEKKYGDAAKQFKRAIAKWPDSAIASRAQFMLGEAYFFQDKYIQARDAYNERVQSQRNTGSLDTLIERQWAIAQYWEKHYFEYQPDPALKLNLLDKTRPAFDTLGQAVKTYESIRLNDPTGPRADDAIMATAGIYFRRGRFSEADEQYTLLRQEYPRSEHQFDAHVLGLQSKLRAYQGPDYDGAGLEEAKKLMKQIRTQFAGRLTTEEKDRLRQVAAEVQLAIEQRELRMAQYYDNTEQYGAARQLYARIALQHGESPIATQARERLAQLGGLPDMPEKRLAWLVDLFPESRERSRVANISEVTVAGATRLAENPEGADGAGGVRPASAITTR